MTRWHAAVVFGTAWVVLAVPSCKPKNPPATTREVPLAVAARAVADASIPARVEMPEPVVDVSREPHAHMKAHFVHASQLRDAVLSGDLSTAKAEAHWLGAHRETGAPPSWKESLEGFHVAAQVVENASNVEEAAGAVGQLGASCGACHRALDAHPTLGASPFVRRAPGVKAHMAAHLAALERLWNGLIVPSDRAWKEGATLLAQMVVPEKTLAKAGVKPAGSVKMLAETLRQLSRTAATTPVDQRPAAFGDLLSTCVGCHTSVHNPEVVASFDADGGSQ